MFSLTHDQLVNLLLLTGDVIFGAHLKDKK